MRKTFSTLAAALLLAACSGEAPENGALIEGQVLGFEQNDKYLAILFEMSGGSGHGIQEDTLRDGHFSFRLDSLAGDHYSISVAEILDGRLTTFHNGPELYPEPGAVVRISGEGTCLRYAKVDNPSREQRLRERFLRELSEEDLKMSLDRDKRNDELDERLCRQALKALETVEIGQYALGKLSSLAREVSDGKEDYREGVQRAYERLSDEQKASREGREVAAYLRTMEKVEAGAPMPDYQFVDLDGKTRQLSEFQGKWILLDFWQAGCGPCIMAIPEIGEVRQEFEDKLSTVSISLDGDEGWRKATERFGVAGNNWRDPDGNAGIHRAFGTGAIPTFVLVSPDGIIEKIQVGYRKGSLKELMQTID